ncbi:MAG TPA: DUF4157 domain-containing protein [Silvibacterium sp.]|nr:DUF4157 domain-containing protein [Silvibacterium sp.]
MQCKLAVGASSDPLESEADSAAEDVVRMEDPSSFGRPAVPPQLRRVGANGDTAGMPNAPPIVHEALRSPGRPLDRETQAFMEPRFGRDLSNVRIHTGALASASARAIKARAYTAGNQIVWDAGCYAPHTDAGKRLLAHELAHVVQQGGMPPGRTTTIRRQAAGAVMDPPVAPAQDAPQTVDVGNAAQGTKEIGMRGGRMQGRAEADLPGLDKMGSKAAKIRDSIKNEIQGKVAQALQPAGPGTGNTAGKEGDSNADEGESLAGLSTGNLALVDTELAEHQRWSDASSKVGAAGSGQRAEFIAESAAGGSDFLKSLGKGAVTGAGIKLLEKGAEKGALKLAAKFAPAVGKFAPLPAVGAVIGGVMSAYDLASRDWKATGETIGRFGEGADIYDTLANSIEAISTVIDVATGVLNVIAGVIGAISIAMWIITILTVGIASPLAATLSTIAGGIGLGSMILDGINSLVLKQLITIFRSLHTFTSEADPRDVVTQGNAIGQAAGAATGFLGGLGGGLAGGAAAEKGLHLASRKPSAKVPGHPTPGAGSGEGPSIKVEPPVDATGGASPEIATGGEPVAGTTENIPETAATPETDIGTAQTQPVAPEIPQIPAAPRPIQITAVPETPVVSETPAIPETKGAPETPSPAETIPAKPEISIVPEKTPATETPTTAGKVAAPEAETAPASAPESEQNGGGDDGKPKKKPLSQKEQARLKEKIRSGEDLTNEDIEKLAQHAGVSPEQMKAEINRVEIEGQGESTGLPDEDVRIVSDEKAEPYLAPDRVTEIDPKTGKPKIDPKTGKVQKKTAYPKPGGRFEVDPGVKQDLRAQARKEAIGHVSGEPEGGAFTDRYTEQTRELMEYESQIDELKANQEAVAELRAKIKELPPEQRKALRADLKELLKQRKGLLKNIDFHHLDTVADHPHTAGSRKSGLLAEKRIHAEAGHGKGGKVDHTFPIEGGILRDEAAIRPADAHVDPQSLPGGRKPVEQGTVPSNRREISRYRNEASEAKRLGKKSRDAAALAQKKALAADQESKNAAPGSKEAKKAASRAEKLRERAQEHEQEAALQDAEARDRELKIKKIEDALPKLDAMIRELPTKGRKDLGRPARNPLTPAAPAAPAGVSATPGAAPAAAAPTPTATPEIQPVPAPAADRPHVPAKLPDPEDSAATQEAALELRAKAIAEAPSIAKPEPVRKPEPLKSGAPKQAGPARQAEQPRPPAPGPRRAPPEPPAPVKETPIEAVPTPEAGAETSPAGPPGTAPKPPASASHLPPASRIGANQPPGTGGGQSDEKEDGSGQAMGGPIVEHVNPNYAPPPCTPQDIVDIENQILERLDARAKSEDAAAIMRKQEANHKANEKPLADVQQGTGEAISATEAHKQAVDRRTQANAKKKENEDHAGGTISDYANKAAELSVITVPMRGFERFTSIADELPDNEDSLSTLEDIVIGPVFDVLIRAKHGIMKMNSDSKHFLEQLDSMDKTMEEQKGAQQDRSKQVAADASTLQETGKNAADSGEQLNKVQETSKDLDTKNKERLTEAGTLHKEAAQNAATLEKQATQKQGQAQDLSSQLQEWAQRHRQARQDSLEQTKSNLEQQGYRVIEVKEL